MNSKFLKIRKATNLCPKLLYKLRTHLLQYVLVTTPRAFFVCQGTRTQRVQVSTILNILKEKKMKNMKVYCVALVLVLAFGMSSAARVPRVRKHYLKFINNLNNKVLNVNCKNLNPYIDLNLHILLPSETYEFNYDITRSMQFSCDLRHGFTSKVFTVSDKATKRACGGNHCIWTAKDDGVYLLNRKTNQNKFMYGWGK